MSMDCEYVRGKLSSLPRAELNPLERSEILEHVQSCTQCSEEYAGYTRAFHLVDRAKLLDPPAEILDGFSADVLKRIDATNVIGLPRRSHRRFWPIAAAFVLGFLGAMVVHVTRSKSEPYPVLVTAEPRSTLRTTEMSDAEMLSAISCVLEENRKTPGCTKEIPVKQVLLKLHRLRVLLADARRRSQIDRTLVGDARGSAEALELVKEIQDPQTVDALIRALEVYESQGTTLNANRIVSTLASIRSRRI